MNFENVVGHQRAKEMLSRALAHSTVHTGYLFTGPNGVGKHLVAATFLRALLCLAGSGEACGVCNSCRHFGGAAHLDMIEVTCPEKKKSISVEQVRDLGAWLAQSPAQGHRKAAIIDPAKALTTEGANALLKTLEEPPPGRVVVLISTSPGALPPTVRSRCQQVSFGSLSNEEVTEVLRRNSWPALSARQAAALAEGSPGSALQRDGRLWQEAAESVRALLDVLAAGDRGAALAFAEATGDARERALASLQALIGFSRLVVRQRLGDQGVGPEAVPAVLGRMGSDQIVEMLAAALETHRRLEGDRPPNAKLALSLLLGRASGTAAGQ